MNTLLQEQLRDQTGAAASTGITTGRDGIARIREVPVANIAGLLESGCSHERIAAVYGLAPEEVRAAVVYIAAT